jgi:isoleucyl-tRNA synthetase
MGDLKKTLLMPSGGFEMRANLIKKEPKMLEKWDSLKLYEKMNANREGCEEFVLHDGPPYANGDIHCGHMLNRLLKDFVVRSRNMMGYKTPFVFGWDTHGLPIEVQVTKSGVDRKKMPVSEFRDLCKDYALKQVGRQKSQIHRLGCLGDYDNPYLTLRPEYEARQIDVFAKMALDGIIYKGVKPVYWSPSSESALAEAEIEYKDVPAKTIYVSFDVMDGKGIVPEGSKIIIWTTTPWTIPSNRGITLNPKFEYGVYETGKGTFVFLASLKEKLASELGLGECRLIKTFRGQELEGAKARHPIYDRESLLMVGNYVTDDSGTGCVHTDPDHGTDDFNTCARYGIKPSGNVDAKGYLRMGPGDPFDGLYYEEANDAVIKALSESGHLLKEEDIMHSYPHDWRTHKPVIFRATPQWFCSIEPIREKLLKEIKEINWVPAWGEGKMENMVKDRADWCISRQRAWGIPIPIIYNEDGSPIVEKKVFDHIRDLVAKEGSNAWFTHSERELLPDGYTNPRSPNGKFRKETDIMDVWFDSGTSWNGVLRERGIKFPADLYLEGNDQYRGWFNSSLTLSTAYLGEAPFKSCLTHGWVMDEKWQKMSKSAGNGIDPTKVANEYGADILRLWAASVNYVADVRISESLIATVSEQYRKVRNTFRFLLSNLSDGEGKPYVPPKEAPELSPIDVWVLGSYEKVKGEVLKAYEDYAFPSATMALNAFAVDLSSFYLDYAKDILYCEKPDSKRRRAVQYVFATLARGLCLLWNPILSFTMDEVYSFLPGEKKESPQLEDMPKRSDKYLSRPEMASYEAFLSLRAVALKALEDKRAEGAIGSALEAKLSLKVKDNGVLKILSSLDEGEKARYFGVSEAAIEKGASDEAIVSKAEGVRCARCRRVRSDVADTEDGPLCERCREAIKG